MLCCISNEITTPSIGWTTMRKRPFLFGVALLTEIVACAAGRLPAQTGSVNEPVRYVGGVTIHQQAHDGQLRPAVGVESFEVLRANRRHPERADNFGWTYNHAPMIAWWNGRYYIEYLSNPLGGAHRAGSNSPDDVHRRAPLGVSAGCLSGLRAAASR
jgi:hypothetical protein